MSGNNSVTNVSRQFPAGSAVGQQDFPRQVEVQKQTIADLKQKIADAQRLASIGEARLNKWRSRTFF